MHNWAHGLYANGSVREINDFDPTSIIFAFYFHETMRVSFMDEEFTRYKLTQMGVRRIPYHDVVDGLRLGKFSRDKTRFAQCNTSSGMYCGVSLSEDYYEKCILIICARFTYDQLSNLI